MSEMTEDDTLGPARLWALYQQACFLMAQRLNDRLSFGIVTACNPQGRICPIECNRVLDNQLQRHIGRQHWVARSLYGCSPDLHHRERSWALLTDKQQVLALAEMFEQQAIYWVDRGELFLTPCLIHGQREISLGDFQRRVVVLD